MKAIGIIDVQKDFMNKDGALYVPNAESIIKRLQELCTAACLIRMPVFFTADEHDGTEPEMSANGGQFPLHCMKGTAGQKFVIASGDYPVFTKRCYNVFDEKYGNKEIRGWLKENDVTEVDLCGVVGNICVEAAAIGLVKLGIKTRILTDAVVWMDLGPDNNRETSVKKLSDMGVLFV